MVLPLSLLRIMPESLKRWDVAIIGGGLAGSAAAMELALTGRKVVLLEKGMTAQDKVCGEFINFEAQHYLSQLGLDLAALNAESITRVRLIRGRKLVSARLPFRALSRSRRVLYVPKIREQKFGAELWYQRLKKSHRLGGSRLPVSVIFWLRQYFWQPANMICVDGTVRMGCKVI
jgi:choline dehydrogenase-like flavoprotein